MVAKRSFQTINDLLLTQAELDGDRRAYTWLIDGEQQEEAVSYAELHRRALGVAAQLIERKAEGQRVLLLYPPGMDYVVAFFGCLYAGAVAVPAYPPDPMRLERTIPRLLAIVEDARATIALTSSQILGMADFVFAQAPALGNLAWLATDSGATPTVVEGQLPTVGPRTLAFLQYTSGSTGSPKGVMLTHANLLHNERLIEKAFGHDEHSSVIGWLPLYHDMGLIGNLLQPLFMGIPCTLMSPLAFLQKPVRWVQAVSRYRATTSGGPSFAYDLCARKVTDAEVAALDLSSWRVAFNGAEPIRAEALARFTARFAPAGFRPTAHYPCYGLAEATLIVSGGAAGTGAVVERFSATALAAGRAERSTDADALVLVSSGRRLGDLRLAIVDTDRSERCEPGAVGEIWVSSESVAQGYWDRAEATCETFEARLTGEAGMFLRTGDLGFLDGDELYVTGRRKDLIIVRGRNVYPQDIEATVEGVSAALRPGCGAAFSVDLAGEERIVVVHELDLRARAGSSQSIDPSELLSAIREAVADEQSVQLSAVVLIKSGTIPKTSSGKIQRGTTRVEFSSGRLDVIAAWRYDSDESGSVPPPTENAPPPQGLLAELVALTAMALRLPESAIDPDMRVTRYGLDSLAAAELKNAIADSMSRDVPMEQLLAGPSLAELARSMESAGPTRRPATRGLAVGAEGPLSPGQEALWYVQRLAPESSAYHVPTAVRVRGDLDERALRRAIARVFARHDSLRTTFHSVDGKPVQRVDASGAECFFVVPYPEDERALERVLAEEVERRFDLELGPLLRVTLFAQPSDPVLLFVMHHLVTDFWSFGIFVTELAALYEEEKTGKPAQLEAQTPSYRDIVAWRRDELAGTEGDRAWAYWSGKLAGELPTLALPTDHARAPSQTFRGAACSTRVDAATMSKLREVAVNEGATLYVTLLAAFEVLLQGYSAQSEVVIGTMSAGREHAELASVIGYFVNPLPLRLRLLPDDTFSDVLRRTRDEVLSTLRHQAFPFPWMVGRSRIARDLTVSPFFQVTFQLYQATGRAPRELARFALGEAGAKMELESLRLESVALPCNDVQFDLSVVGAECEGGELSVHFQYNRDLFEPETIARMQTSFVQVLEQVARNPESKASQLDLLSKAEKQRLLVEWNDTAKAYPTEKLLHELFAEQATKTPDAVALEHEGERLTYRALDQRANQLAHHLKKRGVGPEVLVGICVERSSEMMVGLLGILKAGGAYVPLDPGYPVDRLAYMVEDSGMAHLLTQARLHKTLPVHRAEVLFLDEDWARITEQPTSAPTTTTRAENLAYVIYTSGSTGKAKGVAIAHRSASTLVHWGRESFTREELSGVACATSICFDLSVFELFVPLSSGGRVVLVRDALAVAELTADAGVTLVNTVPSAIAELLRRGLPSSVRTVNLAGEALKPELVDAVYATGTVERVNDLYGPSEDTTYSTWVLRRRGGPETIGRPLPNTKAYVLDGTGGLAPVGVAGELYLAGRGLARGYLARAELTAERFVPDPFADGERMYRTGDRVRWRVDGTLEYLGRIDHQVKVRGFRIELGEIESALRAEDGVLEAVVVAREDAPGNKLLVGYVVGTARVEDVKDALARRLPAYMVPSAIVVLPAMPLTPNGKVDRKALPAPSFQGQASYLPPGDDVEEKLAAMWRAVLGVSRVGAGDNFFELGGHSLKLSELQARVVAEIDPRVSLLDLYRYPTVRALAAHLREAPAPRAAATRAPSSARDGRIAVVGMSCRFPGAPSVDALWSNLARGVESIVPLDDHALRAAGVDESLLCDPRYVKAGGPLDGVADFDASFFGFSNKEAELLDPQHRVFLECAWDALEQAGALTERGARVGVFAGAGVSAYLLENLYPRREALRASLGDLQVWLSNDASFLATRVAYKLGLKGPAITVGTACSSSLVAVHLAAQSLLAGECDHALAGGVSMRVPQVTGYLSQPGGLASLDGHCRAFDAEASGTVFTSGAGAVVLKRYEDAQRDGDTVFAILLGSATNNDGADKVGYTAPSIAGQAEVIARAHAAAGVSAESIGFIECHGTATPIGDPIEVAALTDVFRATTASTGFCAIGSVKTNIGHTDSAAGIAGFIKAVLALRHGKIPPSLNFERPNPALNLAASPFYVNTELRDWASSAPRRAGVSSFGIGGTNAHVVLEASPQEAVPTRASRAWKALLVSARTEAALDASCERLAEHLRTNEGIDLADVAHTLAVGRRRHAYRRAFVCSDVEDAYRVAVGESPKRALSGVHDGRRASVVFMFPGGGAQHIGMGAELYRDEPVFRAAVDDGAERLQPLLGLDLRERLYPAVTPDVVDMPSTDVALPALFVIEYAMAQLWASWGLEPQALIGHSVGEYVAACLSGVFELDDALALVALRGRLFSSKVEAGAMLSVALGEAELVEWLSPRLSLAAVNAPGMAVVAGSIVEIHALERALDSRGVKNSRLHIAVPAHSHLVEPVVAEFESFVRRLRLRAPKIPFVSNVTGAFITAAEATDPRYWARHLRQPVRFSAGVRVLLEDPARCFLEVGPGQTLGTFVRRHLDEVEGSKVIASMRHPLEKRNDTAFAVQASARLWLRGVELDWHAFDGAGRRVVPLPTHPFARERFWIDPPARSERGMEWPSTARHPRIEDWVSVPLWRQTSPVTRQTIDATSRWVVFLDSAGVGQRLVEELRASGRRVVTVAFGDAFGKRDDEAYEIRAGVSDDHVALFTALAADDCATELVHLGAVDPERGERDEDFARRQERGFLSLLSLGQALLVMGRALPARLTVVSSQAFSVTGAEHLCVDHSTVIGPCRVFPHELPGLRCVHVDIDLHGPDAVVRSARGIAAELGGNASDDVVAYRGGQRWVQMIEPLGDVPSGERAASLRPGGTYLVTGGLGGLGLSFAAWMAREAHARLVLTTRSHFPPREDWAQIARTRESDRTTAERVRALLEIEAAGGEVLVVQADVTNREQMARALTIARTRFGSLHGVIHAASVSSRGLLGQKTVSEVTRTMAPKVGGLRVLDSLLGDGPPLDFLVSCSSLSSWLGESGVVDQAAADAFLDAVARRDALRPGRLTVSIGWDAWRDVGMATRIDVTPEMESAKAESLREAISPAEGERVLARVLDAGQPCVLVATQSLLAVRQRNRGLVPRRVLEVLTAAAPPAEAQRRRRLTAPYVAPRNDLERRIAEIWQDLLGVAEVGIHDDFLELGGHSLLALRVATRLRDAFQVELPIGALFEAPTIDELSLVILDGLGAGEEMAE